MLTRAQRKAGRIVLNVVEKYGSALAGGAAMNEAGLIDRSTNGLDFFTNNMEADLGEMAERVVVALTNGGMGVTIVRSRPQFVKLLVDAGRRNSFEIDFGFDTFRWPTVEGSIGIRLSDDELAVNKVLAAFGRVELRDLMDLEALDKHFEWNILFGKAKEKDPGFDLNVLSQMLALNVASDGWPSADEAERTRAFGERMINEIIPRELEKESGSSAGKADRESKERQSKRHERRF